ncbi:hypothetical protein SDC9_145426 [bioreactor metagenome]|jgi:hypothetical protein|uniref:Uncharacterized protein n=1 Tax=bioreactor metagenome TaxID=1076179 RepID=A0A645EC55_9ZZZZ
MLKYMRKRTEARKVMKCNAITLAKGASSDSRYPLIKKFINYELQLAVFLYPSL